VINYTTQTRIRDIVGAVLREPMALWNSKRICNRNTGHDDTSSGAREGSMHSSEGSGFESRQGLGIFIFTTASRPALGTNQPPIQWVPGAFYLGAKRPSREADHPPPSSAEVKKACSYTSTPTIRLQCVVLR
jgi:hypothetical protein